jgi:hypothetical protein
VRDTRLVQTAVIGDEHSDVPIVLPTEAIELDAFRRGHGHDTFWCGVLLGGCGAQLAHKLYVDRQCHFQHYPQPGGDPHACRRPKVGESSADHLYVKSAMSRLLLDHGRAGRFAYPPPIGSLLDVDLEDGIALRVHMDGSVTPDWADDRTPVLGPGVLLEPAAFSRCPYVYRVRCESDGASRRVWIGTQGMAHPTEWVPLSDCTWTEDGLITPTATQILQEHRTTADPVPAAAGPSPTTLPQTVLRFIRGLEAAQRTGTVEHVRRLCAGSGPFLDGLEAAARAEAEQALEKARTWLAAHEDYQQRVFAELGQAVAEKRAWEVRSQMQTAAELTRRGASASEQRVLAAARAFLRAQNELLGAGPGRTTPRLLTQPLRAKRKRSRPEKAPTPQKPRKRSQSPAPESDSARRERRTAGLRARTLLKRLNQRRHSAEEQQRMTEELADVVKTAGDWLYDSERNDARYWIRKTSRAKEKAQLARDRQERRVLPPAVLESAAAAVRGALKKAAREQTTTSWNRLKQQLGSVLPHMTLADRVQVLTLVDQATPVDQALLSSLVAASDPDMATAYRKVAHALGLDAPADDDDLRDVIEADVERVHQYWRHQ